VREKQLTNLRRALLLTRKLLWKKLKKVNIRGAKAPLF